MASPVKSSKILDALKSARSLNDLLTTVDLIVSKIKSTEKISSRVLSSLSNRSILISIAQETEKSGSRIIELDDIQPTTKKKKAVKKGGNKFKGILNSPQVKLPKIKDLVDGSSLVTDLNQNIAELQQALRILKSKDFSKMENNGSAVSMIKAQIDKAIAMRDEQLAALSKISNEYIPNTHRQVKTETTKVIKGELAPENYSRIRSKTFVLSPADNLIQFQSFFVVSDLVNSEGYAYEEYSFVVTGNLNTATAEFVHFVTSLKDPKMPGTFPIGKEVTSLDDLKYKVRLLSSLDDVTVRNNRVRLTRTRTADPDATDSMGAPVKYQQGRYVSSDDKMSMRNASKYIKGIRVKPGKLFIKVDDALGEAALKRVFNKIYPTVRAVFIPAKSRSKHLRWRKLRGRTGSVFFEFILVKNEDPKSQKFINKVSELATNLQMSPRLTREVIRDIVDRNAY